MKRWARRSKSAIIAFKIWQNWNLRRRFASGSIETQHGSSLRRKTLEESIQYIDEQFDDYLKYSQLSTGDLRGKRILELGFGDNVGVALRFLAAGASQVVCVDKFYSERDISRERALYAALRDRMSPAERQRFDEVLDIDDEITFNQNRLRCLNGVDLTAGGDILSANGEVFDIVISRAVIEEIYDPRKLFTVLDGLLAPAGLMLHKIDMTDYGIFSEGGMHPLTFLTIPNSVYRLMATDSGIPNRKLIGDYQQIVKGLQHDSKFFVTSLIGCGSLVPHREIQDIDSVCYQSAESKLNQIRSKLLPPYRDLPNNELMISGVFLISRKQGTDEVHPAAQTNVSK